MEEAKRRKKKGPKGMAREPPLLPDRHCLPADLRKKCRRWYKRLRKQLLHLGFARWSLLIAATCLTIFYFTTFLLQPLSNDSNSPFPEKGQFALYIHPKKRDYENQRTLLIASVYLAPNMTQLDQSMENMRFFVSVGVLEDDDIEYVFILAGDVKERQEEFFNESHPVWSAVFPSWLRSQPNVHFWWTENGFYDLCNYSNLFKSKWFSENGSRFQRTCPSNTMFPKGKRHHLAYHALNNRFR